VDVFKQVVQAIWLY